jgi:hypothetical protein
MSALDSVREARRAADLGNRSWQGSKRGPGYVGPGDEAAEQQRLDAQMAETMQAPQEAPRALGENEIWVQIAETEVRGCH